MEARLQSLRVTMQSLPPAPNADVIETIIEGEKIAAIDDYNKDGEFFENVSSVSKMCEHFRDSS